MISNVNINNPMRVKEVGMQALREALGVVGTARFIQQYEAGKGDYTKEKYDRPEVSGLSIQEIDKMLKNRNPDQIKNS